MRLVLTIISLLIAGCSSLSSPRSAAFDSRPQYPITEIPVSTSLRLRHIGGHKLPHDSTEGPQIGSEGVRTTSHYELVGHAQRKLSTAPSMLSDPDFEPAELRGHYHANDRITVFVSPSGCTILIVEDRSPAYPCRSHILLRRTHGGNWAWSQLDVPLIPRQPSVPVTQRQFPTVTGLTDTSVRFSSEGRTWSMRFPNSAPRG